MAEKSTMVETAKSNIIVVPAAVVFGLLGLFGIQQYSGLNGKAIETGRVEMREDMATLKANAKSVDENMKAATSAINVTNANLETLTKSFDEKLGDLNESFNSFLLLFTEMKGDIRVMDGRVGRLEANYDEMHKDLKDLTTDMIRLREEFHARDSPTD